MFYTVDFLLESVSDDLNSSNYYSLSLFTIYNYY